QIISILLIDAGISVELAGIVIAINPISQIVAMVINGRIIDKPKISERWMLMVGFVLSSLTLLCYAGGSVTGDIIFFIIGQICLGFAWGCIYTGALKYIVNRAPMDRAFYMGIWIGNLQVAKIFSYQIFALLWIIYSPVLVLPFAALIPLLGVLLIFWL
ncbi:MAG TPA: MFS transporter, partial [archaeon]|nr:MFS transporter [archaeon]